MRHKIDGFTLIEILIYLGFFSVIALATSAWVAQIWITSVRNARQASALMELHAAHDVMVRDLRRAPRNLEQWKKKSAQEIIWQSNATDIGYGMRKGGLFRLEGNFDEKNNEWNHVTQSMLIKQIERIACTVHHNKKYVLSINFLIKSHGFTIDQMVQLLQQELA